MRMPLVALLVCSCTSNPDRVAITRPAPAHVAACSSALVVPTACPVYAPGDSDDNDEGNPFPDQINAACFVDDTGATYGTIFGDQGPGLPVFPGGHEIGIYLSFSPAHPAAIDNLTVTGATPTINAYAAPWNIDDFVHPTPEDSPKNRIAAHLVAIGPTGVLYSLGSFGTTNLQVETDLDVTKIWPGQPVTFLWNTRFYVNGPP